MVYLKSLFENVPCCKTHLNVEQSMEEILKERPQGKAASDGTQKKRTLQPLILFFQNTGFVQCLIIAPIQIIIFL